MSMAEYLKNQMVIFINFIVVCFLSTGIAQSSFEEYKSRDVKKFNDFKDDKAVEIAAFKAENQEDFNAFIEKYQEEMKHFRNRVTAKWGEFEEPTPKKMVEYGQDTASLATVDCEKGVVRVEVLTRKMETLENVQKRLENTIIEVVNNTGSSELIPIKSVQEKPVLNSPIFKDQIQDEAGNLITVENAKKFALDLVKKGKKLLTTGKDGESHERYVVTFNLTPDHIKKRMQPYLPYVEIYAKKYHLDPAQVLATIHTESFFNPMARSHSNAIGLMQLVPTSGGKEAYEFVKKKKRIPEITYLFNPEKNIELGCAYIYLLRTRYFRNVKNEKSKLYCSIAGYNTGPGNVARTIIKKRNVEAAVKVINTHDSDKIYSLMLSELPYAETRDYLKKVYERMALYQ